MKVSIRLWIISFIWLRKKYFDQVINGMTIKIEDEINSLARIYVGEEFIGLGKSIKSKDGYFLKMEKVFYDRQD